MQIRRLISLIALVLLTLPFRWSPVLAAGAQSEEVADGSSSAPGRDTESGEVAIRIERFGVGDVVRPGSYAAVRVNLLDSQLDPRDVVVRLHMDDPDGDTILYQRAVTLSPVGTSSGMDTQAGLSLWLYPMLPPSFRSSKTMLITVNERSETGVVGRQIGAIRFRADAPVRVTDQTNGMIAVIGRGQFALDQYARPTKFVTPKQDPEVSHETYELIHGISARVAPTEWLGWEAYETIVWTDPDPATMPSPSRQAIREWVIRGGHLVVILPQVGQSWFGTSGHGLVDLVPDAEISYVRDADLGAYVNLFTQPRQLSRGDVEKTAQVITFTPDAEASPNAAMPIISGPDGPVVMRRLVGSGMVTFIGLPLADISTHLRADSFWHRILGKRFTIPDGRDPDDEAVEYPGALQDITVADRDIGGAVSQMRAAGVGVLLALVVFAVYWVIAGPGGFALLKSKGWSRHAWVFFVGCTATFTVIAWLGATSLRPKQVQGWHLTLMDRVYGQDIDRTRTWIGVLLPRYGEQTVSVVDVETDVDLQQSIQPWADPEAETRGAFPDARAYVVETEEPDSLRVPVRSTMKTFRVDWAGPRPWPLTVLPQGYPTIEGNQLVGQLAHEMPGSMRDITIILVRRQISEERLKVLQARNETGPLLAEAWAWPLDAGFEWRPGETFDLSQHNLLMTSTPSAETRLGILTNAIKTPGLTGTSAPAGSPDEVFTFLSLFSMAEQPDFTRPSQRGSGRRIVQRRETHGWDLGNWFTQPCVIIIGQVADGPTPTPLRVDGREFPTRGRTFVRWVFPLAPDPVTFSGDADDGDD